MIKLVHSNPHRLSRSLLNSKSLSNDSKSSSTTRCPTCGRSSMDSKRSPPLSARVQQIAAQLHLLERICPSAVELEAQTVADSLARAGRRKPLAASLDRAAAYLRHFPRKSGRSGP